MDDGAIFEHMMVSTGGSGVQRMDVIASGAGRRSWAAEAKARIIAESMVAGVNVAEVARRNDMLPQHLYAWRRAAMERIEARGGPAFVPAMIGESHLSHAGQDVPALSGGPEIGIDVCGVTLRIPDGVSADHIGRVLLAVRGQSRTGAS
jgi:transposase